MRAPLNVLAPLGGRTRLSPDHRPNTSHAYVPSEASADFLLKFSGTKGGTYASKKCYSDAEGGPPQPRRFSPNQGTGEGAPATEFSVAGRGRLLQSLKGQADGLGGRDQIGLQEACARTPPGRERRDGGGRARFRPHLPGLPHAQRPAGARPPRHAAQAGAQRRLRGRRLGLPLEQPARAAPPADGGAGALRPPRRPAHRGRPARELRAPAGRLHDRHALPLDLLRLLVQAALLVQLPTRRPRRRHHALLSSGSGTWPCV